ncbi:RNA polymerase sigma factor [Mycobacterium sp. C31M]
MRPFEDIVTDYGPMVLRVCRAAVGPADAEDAWSETFLSAMRAYPELDPQANIEAWLVTIAHRRAIDIGRSRTRAPAPVAEIPETGHIDSHDVDSYDPDLWAALAALPDKQRHTLAYHYLAGLPYAEIAGLLGGSADAARRAAADGIKTLRTTYLKEQP